MRAAPLVLVLVATSLAAAAAGLLVPPAPHPRARRHGGRRVDGVSRRGQWWLATATAATGAGGLLLLPVTSTVVALVASLALVGGVRLALAAAGRRRAAARREQVVDFAEALVGELRAGRPVLAALERSTVSWPEARTAAVAARLGSDVPAVLRDLARLPGAAAARRLAAAFALCSTTGGGLAFAAEQVVETARAEQALDQLVQGELAAARATARLVLLLPVVVLAAADGLGADPWTFLLATPAGTACLAAGVVLALAGLGWIERIAAEAGGGS